MTSEDKAKAAMGDHADAVIGIGGGGLWLDPPEHLVTPLEEMPVAPPPYYDKEKGEHVVPVLSEEDQAKADAILEQIAAREDFNARAMAAFKAIS